MDHRQHANAEELGRAAAEQGASRIRAALDTRGSANIILATGASQFAMLDHLVQADIDWSRVSAFHLDEYVGIPRTHPASFRGYLQARFIDRVATLRDFVFVEGDAADLSAELNRLNHLLRAAPIDVCFAGIGENCHLAFNDPPADFETDDPYLRVRLDEACRRQQLGEGWFDSLDEVPREAISMSIRQILKSKAIILSVPDARKAEAVFHAVKGPVSDRYPASILQQHADVTLHLDPNSASRLG